MADNFKITEKMRSLIGWMSKPWIYEVSRSSVRQYRGMDFPDKEIICKGTIIRKWKENEEKRVEIEVAIENDNGKVTTPGVVVIAFYEEICL